MKTKSLLFALAAGLAVVVVVLVVAAPFGSLTPAYALRPDDAKLVARGEKVYRDQCAACHGARLEGQPDWRTRGPDGLLPAPPHDASGHTWHHPDETLIRITKLGVAKAANLKDYQSAMPIYDGVLSDEEIIAVLSWIKSRWPASVREKHDQINAQSLRTPK
jgi:S-disulfanyl-L-cysteine oxidoreductase SoxD